MAKVHIGHDGKIITYMHYLPRVCCDSTTLEEHTPSCRTRRAEHQ